MRNRTSKYQEQIYDVIQGIGVHMTAEEVHQKMSAVDSSIGIATVYRQLNSLAEQGRILRIRDKDQGYVYDGNGIPHHHFHCTSCGKYLDVKLAYDTSLDEQIINELGATSIKHSILFEGICEHCKEQ